MSVLVRAAARTLPLVLAAAALASPVAASGTDGHATVKMAANPAEGTAKVGDLVIQAAWTRQTPPGAKVAGGYLKVANNGSEADRLIGARAGFADRVEIHEMAVTDGVMRMTALADGLEIPPGGSVELKPGGYHIMFMGLTTSPQEGRSVPVTLVFARAGEVTVTMPVAAIGAPGPAGSHGDHKGMDHRDANH